MVTEVGSIVPSMSVSLEVTLITTGVSSFVEATSSLATGASFTAFTVIVTVAISHCAGSGVPLSHTW